MSVDLAKFIVSLQPLIYTFIWFGRWLSGISFAFGIRAWLLGLWPNIELDFGTIHHKKELQQRQGLWAVISLVVLPVVTALLYDFMKLGF
jgi:hypothetical protein